MAGTTKKKCRQYSQEYLKFGFVTSLTNETIPMCLLCEKTFSNDAMKPSKMKDHLERMHLDKKNECLSFFQALKEDLAKRANILNACLKSPLSVFNREGLKVSYNISLNIAKKEKSYTIGDDIIIPAIKDVIENVMKGDPKPVLKSLSLSANTVQQNIEEMADNVRKTLTSELQRCRFSLQLDAASFGRSIVLMAFVKYYSPSQVCIVDEFLFAKYLQCDLEGEAIFLCLDDYLIKYNISIRNITTLVTNGLPAMVDFAALLQEKVPKVHIVHCVLHKHHLVTKRLSVELHDSLNVCIKSVNKMKSYPLSSQLLATLSENSDESFLLDSEIRWLSRGETLQRLVGSLDFIIEFLKSVDPLLSEELNRCKNHVFYLADLFSKFDEVQRRLQSKDVTMIKARTILMGFQVKIGLFISSLSRKDFKHFPNLCRQEESQISDRDLEVYIMHLANLIEDFKVRFEVLEKMNVPEWIVSPLDLEMENVNIETHLEDELVDMRVDLEAISLFKTRSLSDYWSNVNTSTKYPKLSQAVQPFLLAFPSSYMTENGFSHVNALLSKYGNRLELEERADLRLKLASLQPNINFLVDAHQTRPSQYFQ